MRWSGHAWDEADRLNATSSRHRQKVASALALITTALQRAPAPYVAFSGGKDSTVLLALVESVTPGVPVIWSDDEMEYPETVAYMQSIKQIDEHEQMTITLGWAEHGGWFRPWVDAPYWRDPLPGTLRIDEPVELWAARERGHELTFTGLRMEENVRRRNWLVQNHGLYAWDHGWRCCPLWDWTADDVWAYIAGRGIPYNAAYDRLTEHGITRNRQRVGPMCLTPRAILAECWPSELARLEARYGRWRI